MIPSRRAGSLLEPAPKRQQLMLYSLDLERQRRDATRTSPGTAGVEGILAAALDHPEHAAELLLEQVTRAGAAGDAEAAVDLTARLLEMALRPDAPASLRTRARIGLEWSMEAAFACEAPRRLERLAPAARRLFRGPGGGDLLEEHLEAMHARALAAAREADAYRYQAWVRYLAERLRPGGPDRRAPALAFLDLYGLLPAFRTREKGPGWYLPTLRALERALEASGSRALVAAEPLTIAPRARELWLDLSRFVAQGEPARQLSTALLGHLLRLTAWLPEVPELRDAFGHLPRLLAGAPGGPRSPLARRLRARAAAAVAAAGAPPEWPELEARMDQEAESRELEGRVATSLRPQKRLHLRHLLEAQRMRVHPDPTVAALYPATAQLPFPLLALYFDASSRDEVLASAGHTLDVHLEKLEGVYRLSVVDSNRKKALTSRSYLDELSTHPVRRSLTRSGGTYAVAMVELETLAVAAVRFQSGYLDFTGAYFRGIERVLAQDLEAAIREFEKALAANPRLRGVHCHLGLCYRKLARGRLDLERSSTCYERELGIDPHSGDALNNLGVLALAEGRLEEALELLERAVDADPAHLTALTNLAATCLALPRRAGIRDRVREVLHRLYGLAGESPVVTRLVDEARDTMDLDLLGELRLAPR